MTMMMTMIIVYKNTHLHQRSSGSRNQIKQTGWLHAWVAGCL